MSLKSIDATAVGNTSFKNIQYWTPKYVKLIGEHSLSSTVHAGTLFTARWDAWPTIGFSFKLAMLVSKPTLPRKLCVCFPHAFVTACSFIAWETPHWVFTLFMHPDTSVQITVFSWDHQWPSNARRVETALQRTFFRSIGIFKKLIVEL